MQKYYFVIWILSTILTIGIGYFKTRDILRWLLISFMCIPLGVFLAILWPKNKLRFLEQ